MTKETKRWAVVGTTLLSVAIAFFPLGYSMANCYKYATAVNNISSLLLVTLIITTFITLRKRVILLLFLLLPVCLYQYLLFIYAMICWSTNGFAP